MPRERNDWNAPRVDTARRPSSRSSRSRYVFHFPSPCTAVLIQTTVTRSTHFVMRSSTLVSRAGLALVLLAYNLLPAWAQTSTPTNTWVPAPTCSAGSNDTAANGGRYTDRFNNVWETRCGQAHTGPLGWSSLTNGQGYYGCVKGCARRPGCTAFTYVSSGAGQTSPTTGSGSCQYRSDKGEYTAGGSTTYASAHLIVAGRGNNSLPVSMVLSH